MGEWTQGEWACTVGIFAGRGWDNDKQRVDIFSGDTLIATYFTECAEFPSQAECAANAHRIVACVNGCANIPNPAAIGKVVGLVREGVANCESCGGTGLRPSHHPECPHCTPWREALAELDKEPNP